MFWVQRSIDRCADSTRCTQTRVHNARGKYIVRHWTSREASLRHSSGWGTWSVSPLYRDLRTRALEPGKRTAIFRSECSAKSPRPAYPVQPTSRGANRIVAHPLIHRPFPNICKGSYTISASIFVDVPYWLPYTTDKFISCVVQDPLQWFFHFLEENSNNLSSSKKIISVKIMNRKIPVLNHSQGFHK